MDLASGYIKRAAAGLPKQGERRPWMMRQNYLLDFADMRLGRVDDGVMRFGRAEDRAGAAADVSPGAWSQPWRALERGLSLLITNTRLPRRMT